MFIRSENLARAYLALPFVVAILALVCVPRTSQAQSVSVPSDVLNQLQQQALQNGSSGNAGALLSPGAASQNLSPQAIMLQPAAQGGQAPLPPSRLEQIMSARAGARLQQFGYDQLGRGVAVTIPQTGAVQDDYVLGPGDEIVVSLRGQENGEFRTTVDRNGQVILPRLSPISATGRSFGSFRQDLEAAVHRAYVATNASISIGRVRQISVLVSGEVNNPGQRLLTGLSSVVDALLLSNGVKKTGSLRAIRVERGSREYSVDLYSVLTDGSASSSLRLADGDRILVPPLGKTVSVTGLVRQPGIYELAPGQLSMSVRALMAIAGDEEVRGRYRLSLMHIDEEGRSDLTPVSNESALVGDSDILFVQLGADQTTNQAILSGGLSLAGAYPLVTGTKLSDVLKAPGALGTAPYALFGFISRRDPRTLLRTLIAFTPTAVLSGNEDQALQTDDIIHPLTEKEAHLVTTTIRLYLERRDQAEQVLRDPLSTTAANSQPIQTQTVGTNQAVFQSVSSALVVSNGLSASEEAQNQESDIQLIGNLTQRQLDMITGGQVKLSDFRYVPQGNADPLSRSELYIPAQEPNSVFQQQPSPSFQQQPGPSFQQQPALQNRLQQPLSPNESPAVPGNSATEPLPPNFQEQPNIPGTFPTNRDALTFDDLAQQLGVDPLILANFMIDHEVTLDGAVRGPGTYFVGPNASLKDLVEAAGGTLNWADDSGVELISTAIDSQNGRSVTQRIQLPLQQGLFASYIVKPHDEFRFNQVYSDADIGSVTIQGEVRFSGTYQITRGERLSDLLARAGGLTSVAYPYGTVFLRKTAAEAEHDGYLRAANEVEDQLIASMTRVGNDKIDPSTFASMQTFVSDLRNQKAVGRIAVTADPSLLAAQPALDPLLEPGDVIYIPQRPSTVMVLGQVSQPGSFSYRPGMTLADYIGEAGGYSALSDKSMTFIVMPDGTAHKVENSWLTFSSESLPPGSTIVVPRDVTPLDTRQLVLDISSIFSQFAVSIASVAVLAAEVK